MGTWFLEFSVWHQTGYANFITTSINLPGKDLSEEAACALARKTWKEVLAWGIEKAKIGHRPPCCPHLVYRSSLEVKDKV